MDLNCGLLLPDMPIERFTEFSPVSVEKVVSMIKCANKTNCLNDPFDINKVNLHDMLYSLADVYTAIINLSLSTGTFPLSEKVAYVRPLAKSGKDASEFSSYRPVSNLSFLSKIMEKIILEQLLIHFEKFDSIPVFQSAYRKYHSVETAICKIYNDLITEKCRNKCTLLILLDQTAAFDTVNHNLLLNDLNHFGVDGNVFSWFKSYLEGRSFRVVVNDSVSDAQSLYSSVPQGSILGPYLYMVYTIELYYLLQSLGVSSHFYADDTQIYVAISNIESTTLHINSVLNAVKNWMDSKNLKLNMDKTDIIIVGSDVKLRNFNEISSLRFLNSDISLSRKIRNLGVLIDSRLTLDDQIMSIKKKAISNLRSISHIRRYIDKDTCIKLVHNLVFFYC